MSDIKCAHDDIIDAKELVPNPKNPNTHPKRQIELLAKIISYQGWRAPISISTRSGYIVRGHGRHAAAMLLGCKCPVDYQEYASDAEELADLIADNQIAELATIDNDLLVDLLQEINTSDLDLELTGFELRDINRLLGWGKGLTDPDAAPPEPAIPVTQSGDLWLMDNHRLLCGDCTIPSNVSALLGTVKPILMVTDPPYGVKYDADWRNRAERSNGEAISYRAIGKVANDERVDWSEAYKLFPGAIAYIWHAGTKAHLVAASILECNFQIRAQIVWVKQRHVISRGNYHSQHEPCFYIQAPGSDDNWRFVPDHEVLAYSVRDKLTANWQGSRKQSTTWFIEHIKSETGHSTQKPIECMKRPIENNSSPGQAVYDPFIGSGTTDHCR